LELHHRTAFDLVIRRGGEVFKVEVAHIVTEAGVVGILIRYGVDATLATG
jgi:hypothetical protein